MAFPRETKLKKIRERLESAEPSLLLPENATKAEIIKYKICEKFVAYLLDHQMTQAELARRLGIDSARLNEIVKYKIDLFTIDKLIEFVEKLDPNIDIRVA